MVTRYIVTSYIGASSSWGTYANQHDAYADANSSAERGERVVVMLSYVDDDGVVCWETLDDSAWRKV